MTIRIERSFEGEYLVYSLCGRIELEELSELQAPLDSVPTSYNIVLDLKDVKLVDRDVVRFLARHEAEGTVLRNCPAYIREWISREANADSSHRGRRPSGPSG